MEDASRKERNRLLEGWVVCGLLVTHAALAYAATLGMGPTFDEPLHIVAGASYWRYDDYRLHPENGNLPQRLCTLPLVLAGAKLPEVDSAEWQTSDLIGLARQFLYDGGNDPASMLAGARAMSVVWSVALCFLTYLWSRAVHGKASAAIVSLGLAAFWPSFLAHGPLATSDACGAVFFTAGAWALWSLLRRATPGTLAAASLAVGGAAVAKHSCLMLAPLAIVYGAALTALGRPLELAVDGRRWVVSGRVQRSALAAAVLVIPFLAAVVCIWASCGFRYDPAGPGCGTVQYRRYGTLATCAANAGEIGMLGSRLAEWRLLPESWIFGLCYVAATIRGRHAFALGHYSSTGWWWYFPLCLAVKNTLPSLAICAWGLSTACRRVIDTTETVATSWSWRKSAEIFSSDVFRRFLQVLRNRHVIRDAPQAVGPQPARARPGSGLSAPLLVLAVLWPTFLFGSLNIGERHLLPAYPPLIVLAGGVWLKASRRGRWLLVVLVALHAIDVVSRFPSFLPYFNQVVAPGESHRWLVDSNSDWGQGLPRLEEWIRDNRRAGEPLTVDYFGTDVVQRKFPDARILGEGVPAGTPQRLEPGLYCIGLTAIAGVYDSPYGLWCERFENGYRNSRDALFDETGAVRITDLKGLDFEAGVFNTFQAARLRAFLRHRRPEAIVADTMLVYRLSAADLRIALDGQPPELATESWMAEENSAEINSCVLEAAALAEMKELAAAAAALRYAVSLDGFDPRTHWELGLVQKRQREFAAAAASFTLAHLLSAADPRPIGERANLFVRVGLIDRALDDYAASIRRDPFYLPTRYNRATVLLKLGRRAEATVDVQILERHGADLPPAWRDQSVRTGGPPEPPASNP